MIHVTHHAIERYRERVADLPDAAIVAVLSSPAMETAARFGCECVLLGTRHRVVIDGNRVVTVKPRRGE